MSEKIIDDPEVAAMNTAYQALKSLDLEAQLRAMEWLYGVLIHEGRKKQKALQKAEAELKEQQDLIEKLSLENENSNSTSSRELK